MSAHTSERDDGYQPRIIHRAADLAGMGEHPALPAEARDLLRRVPGWSDTVFDAEMDAARNSLVQLDAAEALADAVRDDVRHGTASPALRAAYIRWSEVGK